MTDVSDAGPSKPLAVAGRMRAAWRRLAPFLGMSRARAALLIAASVAAGLVEGALLAAIAAIATAISAGRTHVDVDLGPIAVDASLAFLFTVGFGLALARGALGTVTAYLPAVMSADAMASLRRRLFDAFSDSTWSTQASQRDGYFQALMTVHVGNASVAIINLGQAVTAFFMLATLLLTALALSVGAAAALIVLSGMLFLAMRPLSRRTQRWAEQLSEEGTEYTKGMQEVVRLAEETQVFGASGPFRQRFYDLVEQVRVPLWRSRFLSRLVPVLYQSLALVVLLGAMVFVAGLDTAGLPSLTAVVLILVRSLAYGNLLQASITRMYELTPFMNKLRDAIDDYDANRRVDGTEPMPPLETLAMRNVRFAYPGGGDVLRSLDFEVAAGEAIGIVGPSGAGKSTLVQLLLRLRDPGEGRLEVNGVDGRHIDRRDWQRSVAYVPQSPLLMWGTVADNIRFHRLHLDDANVERAARLAHIHDEILSWPQGYDTVIGERAAAVSGGQRQRLCLARALAARPAVLILDEPTSALDVRSELAVQASLESLKGEMVLFLVSHRLSTLAICDRVMVIVDGRLQAMAPPEQLQAGNAFYREAIEITRQQSRV